MLAGSQSAQTKYNTTKAGLEMEPTGEAEEREAKEQLATVNGGGDERGSHKKDRDRETSLRTYIPHGGIGTYS